VRIYERKKKERETKNILKMRATLSVSEKEKNVESIKERRG